MSNRSLILPLALLGVCVAFVIGALFAMAGVAMGWFSLFGYEHPKRELARIEATYGNELDKWRAAREDEKDRYHAALPADAPIAPDWEWQEAVKGIPTGYDEELLLVLLGSYLDNPRDMSASSCDCGIDKLESLSQYSERLTNLEQQFVDVMYDSDALRARLEAYLNDNALLDELEYALRRDVIDLGVWDTESTDELANYSQERTAMRLLFARTLAYGLQGDEESAFDMLLHFYDLELRSRRSTLDGLSNSTALGRRADKVLALLTPMITWTPERVEQVEARMAMTPVEIAELIRFAAAGPHEALLDMLPFIHSMNHLPYVRYGFADELATALEDAPREFFVVLQRADARVNEDEVDESGFELMLGGFRNMAVQWHLRDVVESTRATCDTPLRPGLFRLARELEVFRKEHGAFPQSLDTMFEGDSLVSYCTGNAVLYVRDGDGYRLETSGEEEPIVLWQVSSGRPCEGDAPTEIPG